MGQRQGRAWGARCGLDADAGRRRETPIARAPLPGEKQEAMTAFEGTQPWTLHPAPFQWGGRLELAAAPTDVQVV